MKTDTRPPDALSVHYTAVCLTQQALRRRFYLACAFMTGPHASTLTAAIEANDLDTAQVIWEKHTGLTGP